MDTLDLDINNYNIKDIEKFFRLKPNQKYNASDIELKEYEIREQLLQSGHINKRFKSDLIEFLTKAKQWLTFVKCGKAITEKQPTTIPKNYKLDTLDTPFSKEHSSRTDELINHPERQFIYANPSEFFQGTLNPLNTRVITKTLNIDTRFRDNLYTTQCSDFNMNIQNKLNKVVSMQLSSIELPIVFYNISESFGNNYLYIKVNYNTFAFQNNCLKELLNKKCCTKSFYDASNVDIFNNEQTYWDSSFNYITCIDSSYNICEYNEYDEYNENNFNTFNYNDNIHNYYDNNYNTYNYNENIYENENTYENTYEEIFNETIYDESSDENMDVESVTDIIDEEIMLENIDTYLNDNMIDDEFKKQLIDEELDIKNEKDKIKIIVQYEKMQNKLRDEYEKMQRKIKTEYEELQRKIQKDEIKKNMAEYEELQRKIQHDEFKRNRIRYENMQKKIRAEYEKKITEYERKKSEYEKKRAQFEKEKIQYEKKRAQYEIFKKEQIEKKLQLVDKVSNDKKLTKIIDNELIQDVSITDKDLVKLINDEITIIIPDGNYNSHGLINTINNLLSPIDEDGNLMNPNCIFSYIELSLDIDEHNSGTGKVIIKPSETHSKYINSITLDFTKNLNGTSDTTSLFSKIGWNLGFIKPQYSGSKQYISDTVFEMSTIKYIYLAVDDFNNNVNNQFVGLFNKSILNPNILARISIKGTSFSSIKENNYTIITEPRKYFGPVDIQRLRIQLYDEYGRILNMNNANYSFCLDFKLLYDL
jgi:hypothetical protein